MRWHILSTRFKFDCAIPGSSACFSTCVASMSAAGASPFSCGHLDPAHTCTPRHVGAKRSLSVPLKRRRAFSSPHRPCRCSSLTSRAGAASVAASVVVEAQPEQQDLVYSPRVSVDNRLRQLEASFRAQSAAELESSQEQLSASDGGSDLEGNFVQLERSWQAQTEASTSGRQGDANSVVPFRSRQYQQRSSSRSKRRSSRLYAAATRRNQSQSHGVPAMIQPQPSSCPDSHYCAVLRNRLQIERQKNRVSRSGYMYAVKHTYSARPSMSHVNCRALLRTVQHMRHICSEIWHVHSQQAGRCVINLDHPHALLYLCFRSLAQADAISMFLFNLGDSSLLNRSEEGQLSRIFQKGCTVDSVGASLTQQLNRPPTEAELADALPDELHGLTAEEVHQASKPLFVFSINLTCHS